MHLIKSIEPRSRWPVACCALALLWTVGAYTADGSRALLALTAVCSVIATALPRPLLRTTRSVIWSGVLLGIIAFSANLSRIVPPEEIDLFRTYQYDRMVTLALIPALTVLFVRPNRATVTIVLTGCLPLLMLTLIQQEEQVSGMSARLTMWVCLGLLLLAGLAQRATRPRPLDAVPVGWGEQWMRVLALMSMLVVAVMLFAPISTATVAIVEWAHAGLGLTYSPGTGQESVQRLSLQAPPGGFEGRVRPLIAIRAPGSPGYLREAAYAEFRMGQWHQKPESVVLEPIEADTEDGSPLRYRLRSGGGIVWKDDECSLPDTPWRVELLPGYRGSGLCLPADAIAFSLPADIDPSMDQDGIVTREPVAGVTFAVWTVPGGGVVKPSPLPQSVPRPARLEGLPVHRLSASVPAQAGTQTGESPDEPHVHDYVAQMRMTDPHMPAEISPGYLAIPDTYAASVSNWVASCEGLLDAASSVEAMAAVIRHFHDHYEYSLAVTPLDNGSPGGSPSSGGLSSRPAADLLSRFMETRRGHCTLFATAATFMLRAWGIPARVVGGYVCHERHPLTGRWVARERDGHAWCEAWDEVTGRWRLVEATPPGNLPGGFDSPHAGRLLWEAISGYWRNFIAWLVAQNPLVVLAEAGVWVYFQGARLLRTPLGFGVMVFFFSGIASLVWRRRRGRRSGVEPVERLRARLIRAMARIERRRVPSALRRRADEPWSDWIGRVSDQLPPVRRQRLTGLLKSYQALRYRRKPDMQALREWLVRESRG